MIRSNHEISFGGQFELMWREVFREPYHELADLNETLSVWLPISLLEEPEADSLAMQLRNALKALCATCWTAGTLNHDLDWLRKQYADQLGSASAAMVEGMSLVMAAADVMVQLCAEAPTDPAAFAAWRAAELNPFAAAVQARVQTLSTTKDTKDTKGKSGV